MILVMPKVIPKVVMKLFIFQGALMNSFFTKIDQIIYLQILPPPPLPPPQRSTGCKSYKASEKPLDDQQPDTYQDNCNVHFEMAGSLLDHVAYIIGNSKQLLGT